MENELYHYGIKGMKWGIRKKRDTSLRDQQRKDKYLSKTQSKTQKNRAKLSNARSYMESLKKEGTNHADVKRKAQSDVDWEMDYKISRLDRERMQANPNAKATSQSAKQLASAVVYTFNQKHYDQIAYDSLVSDTQGQIDRYSKKARQWQAANKAVMDLPASATAREYRKAIRNAKRFVKM